MKISLRRRKARSSSTDRAEKAEARHPSPVSLFLIVFSIYNLIGLMDTPWTITGAYDKSLCWELFLTGLAALSLTSIAFRRHPRRDARVALKPRTSVQLSVFFFLVFIASLAATIAISGGIPLLQGESRFGNSPLAFNLAQFYGFWVLVRTISDIESNRNTRLIQPIIYLVGALCFGYRTPILIFGITLLVYFITFRFSVKKSIALGISAGTLIIAFSAIFSAYRISQNYDIFLFFKNIDFQYIRDHQYLIPFVPALAMFDFSQETIYKIGANLHDHMYGNLLISNYETFLPGHHWGARNIIGDLTGARWVAGRPMSITPTLQGALFVDFGYVGVFLGFCLIALGIDYMWKSSQRWGALGKFSFCYLMTLSIMAIHNGYWDVGFAFFLFFLFAIRIFDSLKRGLRPRMA